MFAERRKIYWWHLIVSLVTVEHLLKMYLAYREYLCLKDAERLAERFTWYKPAALIDPYAFWKIFCASTLKLVLFGFGIFPATWELWSGLFARLSHFWSSVLYYGTLSASVVVLEAITRTSRWEVGKLLAPYVCGLAILALFKRFSKMRKTRQFLVTILSVGSAICILVAVMQLAYRSAGTSLPAEVATDAAVLCARVGFDVRNVRYIEEEDSCALASVPFPVIVLGDPDEIHTSAELVAVLAHELGHWRLWHGYCTIVAALVVVLLYSAVLVYCYDRPSFYRSLGFRLEAGQPLPLAVGIFATGCLIQTLAFFVDFARCSISQLQEYQADAYAASLGYGYELMRALVKMGMVHQRALVYDKITSLFSRTHPCMVDRIGAIKKLYPGI